MRLRSKLIAVGLLLTAMLVTASVLATMTKQVPAFYRDAATSSYLAQSERSSALMTRVQDLQNDIRTKPEWSAAFAVADLNCFCQEMINDRPGGLASLLPEKCHSPRLAIEGDRIKLGFTYGDGFWSTVVWLEFRLWLPKHDTNVIAMELISLNAGSLPMSTQSLLEQMREAVHDANVEVSWYRHEGRPIGLFRFYANQVRPATQIHTLKVADGTFTIAGRTRLETTSGRE